MVGLAAVVAGTGRALRRAVRAVARDVAGLLAVVAVLGGGLLGAFSAGVAGLLAVVAETFLALGAAAGLVVELATVITTSLWTIVGHGDDEGN